MLSNARGRLLWFNCYAQTLNCLNWGSEGASGEAKRVKSARLTLQRANSSTAHFISHHVAISHGFWT
eukprot:3413248-Amphidinium_carterae.1